MARDFRADGVPLIRLAGVKPGAGILDGCNFLDEDMVAKKWSHFRVEQGDVILSTSASLGEVATVTSEGVGAIPYTGLIRMRGKADQLDQAFLPWILRAPDFARQVQEMGVGSVMSHFGPSHLKQMTLALPPIAEQRRIAGVLATLDDLVKTNQQLIETMLSMADAVALAAVSTGELLKFGDVVAISGGGTPSTKNASYWGGEIEWATPTDVTALPSPYLSETSRRITQEGLDACSSSLHPAGSIFMTSRATIGAFAISQKEMATNQGFIVLEPRANIDRWFLFHELRRRVPEFIQRANGSTFLELSRGVFKDLTVVWPDESVRSTLAQQLDPIHASAAALQLEIADLSRVRNEILPLLLSGAVTVSEVAP